MTNQELKANLNLIAVRIKEIFRYTQEKAGEIKYVDYNNNLNNIQTKCNTVIYGRRGSGKTTLFGALQLSCHKSKVESTFIDYNLYTDHRYPDLLIANLISVFEDLKSKIELDKPFFLNFVGKKQKKEILKKLSKDIVDLNVLKDLPLEFDQDLENSKAEFEKVGGNLSATAKSITSSFQAGVSAEKGSSEESKKKISMTIKKINHLYKNIDEYRKTLSGSIKYLEKNAYFLLLDDFYHIQIEDQPQVIDYLFRLCKGQKAYIKVASVSHRTKLYERKENGVPYGLEESADLQKIDLDFLLQRFDETEIFLKNILNNLCKDFGIKNVDDLFVSTSNGFKRLVWASGGVPRDFLQLIVYCVPQIDFLKQNPKIDYRVINKAAHNLFLDKQKNLETAYAKKRKLDLFFNEIFDFCTKYNNRTAFLINKNSKQKERTILNKLNDIIDFKIIHLIHSNLHLTHPSKDVFEAYCLDLGSYALWLHKKIGDLELQETDILKKDAKGYPQTIRSLRERNTLSEENINKGKKDIKRINQKISKKTKTKKEDPSQQSLFPW